MRPKAIDLFCGAGGMSLGFEQAGFDIVCGVDRDPHHVAAHERNFPYGKTICASVTELTGDQLLELSGTQEIDLVFGGPPCQGFSTMGKRDALDPRNSLVGHYVRLIEEIRPKAFVMENVPGMHLGGMKIFFDHVLDRLSRAGYAITRPVSTLLACEFGAPQRRERLFVIGVRSDIERTVKYPERPLKGQPFAKCVGEALQGLPDVDSIEALFKADDLHFVVDGATVESAYARALSGLERDPTDLSYPRVSTSGKLFGNKLSRHAPSSIALYDVTLPGEMVPGHKLPRLHLERVAPTLRAGTESERGSHTAPRPIHPVRPRCITVREAARLHGYPDWFAFYPAVHHGFRQVGNSVSPFVARAVGVQVIRSLGWSRSALRPRRKIELEDKFILRKAGKRSERRISHLDEFPKVINHLFQLRYEPRTARLRDPYFSVHDIAQAVEATAAKMPRVRPDRFIAEFSKTRNAREIIAVPLQHGYSVLECESGGKFVPVGTPRSVAAISAVKFNSAEIKGAERLRIPARHENLVDLAFALLAASPANNVLRRVRRQRDLISDLQDARQPFECEFGGATRTGLLWVANGKSYIRYENLLEQSARHCADVVALIFGLTHSHIGLGLYAASDRAIRELHKAVYHIEIGLTSERSKLHA